QRGCNQQSRQRRAEIDRDPCALALLAKQYEHGRRQQWQDDRYHDEVRGTRHHESSLAPSTWSVPLSPRDASRPTRNNAVDEKQATHAEDEKIHRVRKQREAHDHLEGSRTQHQPDAGPAEYTDDKREQ